MPTRRRPPIAGLRRLLLVLFIVGLAVVAAVFALRRRGDKPPVDGGGGGLRPEGEITLIGEGFEYTLSEDGRPVFDIQGESVKVRRGTVVLLEDVSLTLYDEEGTPYRVAAKEASYDRESHEASLDGSLRLIGPEGLVLTADGLTIGNQGQRVETRGPAELLYAGLYRATARRIVARLRLDLFALIGRPEVTRLEGPEPPTLTAGSITYRREDGLVRAETRVRLSRGADFLTTDRLNIHLTPDARRAALIHARRSVDGRMRLGAAGGPAAARVRGDRLVLHFDDAGEPERAELEGRPGEPAVLVAEGAGGLDDALAAARVEVRVRAGGGHDLEATGAPVLTETRRGAPAGTPPLRALRARGPLTALLDAAGEVERVVAEGGVEYHAADLEAHGERMTYSGAAASAELSGDPVRVVSARGELLAPRVVYEQESGLLRAEGGVRTVLAEDAAVGLEGSPLGAGEGPVRVESETAFWRDEPPSALFRGDVRAWRGKSLLLAAELRGEREDGAEVLSAGGGVKTVWSGRPGAADDAGGEAGEGAGEPVEVRARTMVYRRPAGTPRGTVVYSGGVESEQGERTLVCRELVVELDDDGRAERMTCTGAVRLEDRAAGNTATGERAVYDLAARTVDITGAPVKLTKGDGGAVEGRRVLYEVDAGRARVLAGGAEGAAAPTPESAGPEAAPPPPGSGG